VAILSAQHLFEQAERLVEAPSGGRPRQVDIRRAISASYYGIFHATLTAAADRYVGATKRATNEYGLVYRSIDHRRLREVCDRVSRPTMPPKYFPYAPPGGFAPNIAAFATAVLELQQQRHTADYDPMVLMTRLNAVAAIATARAALRRFDGGPPEHRAAFFGTIAVRT
jgi:uncharacterized protein (UPF0332 family)